MEITAIYLYTISGETLRDNPEDEEVDWEIFKERVAGKGTGPSINQTPEDFRQEFAQMLSLTEEHNTEDETALAEGKVTEESTEEKIVMESVDTTQSDQLDDAMQGEEEVSGEKSIVVDDITADDDVEVAINIELSGSTEEASIDEGTSVKSPTKMYKKAHVNESVSPVAVENETEKESTNDITVAKVVERAVPDRPEESTILLCPPVSDTIDPFSSI